VQVWLPEVWGSPAGVSGVFCLELASCCCAAERRLYRRNTAGRSRRCPGPPHPEISPHRGDLWPSRAGRVLRARGIGRTYEGRVANALSQCVIVLGGETDGMAGPAVVADHPPDPVSSTRR
jgi:hypothetical protein